MSNTKRIYKRRYCSDWENESELKDWIRKVPTDDAKAFCKYCRCEVRAHRTDLNGHISTEKHRRNANPGSSMRTLTDVWFTAKPVNNKVKCFELEVAVHVACHLSVLMVDHLGEIIKTGTVQSVQLHRSKCTALIKRVLACSMEEQLLAELAGNPYSLIIDESTDRTTEKQLCIVVRFYSFECSKIITAFLGLISLNCATAEGIFNALVTFLNDKNIKVEKCIGLATDGCNVMTRHINSVITRFKSKVPKIVHIKCIYFILYNYVPHML